VTVNQVLERIAQISARPLTIRREPEQKGEMRHTYADTSLARTDLGFEPRVALDTGLEQQYRWLVDAWPLP
jgi:UDP-glucose 4-epimerase